MALKRGTITAKYIAATTFPPILTQMESGDGTNLGKQLSNANIILLFKRIQDRK